MFTNMGSGVFLEGQQRHFVYTNASRGLTAIAEFLVVIVVRHNARVCFLWVDTVYKACILMYHALPKS